MPRLRTVSPSDPGWKRLPVGRGFRYLDADGQPLPAAEVARIRALVIPPAWKDVWVCPFENGHIQAVGFDARGRKQYLYHPYWRIKRDIAKHERVVRFAARLPRARDVVAEALDGAELTRERALATAFRLLDLGYFRMGSDTYADENGSYGLTTLRRRHVVRAKGELLFDFPAKSGVRQRIAIADKAVLRAVEQMLERRGPGTVLAWRDDAGSWTSLTPTDVNGYLRELIGIEVSAKDFRTWHGTVHAAVALAERTDAHTVTARKRAIAAAFREVSDYLGNTPAVARSAYVDPRIVEHYLDGRTIRPTLQRLAKQQRSPDELQAAIERATLKLLRARNLR